MNRFAHFALATAFAISIASSARANDQSELSFGVGGIAIQFATPTINLSVRNLSGSPFADQRELTNISADPQVKVDGQIFCKAILGGETRLTRAQLMYGNPIVMSNPGGGASIMPFGVWDTSPATVYGGNADDANVTIEHTLDLPSTWNGGFIFLGLNPVKVVEDRLANYVSNGGSAVDFLRTDDIFEVEISVNLVGECENTSDYGVDTYAGYTRRSITVAIFYNGDPNIQYEPIQGGPDGVQMPSLPSQFFLNMPLANIVTDVDSRDDGSSDDGSNDDGRQVTFARFPTFDIAKVEYVKPWSGWVTYSSDLCPEQPMMAVTPDGECVLVDACMPVEFDSCRVLEGCCEAPLPGTIVVR